MSATKAQLRQERDFLLARLTRGWGETTDWVGISSNHMLRVAIAGEAIDGFCRPHDNADLRRCEETYRRAPEHLKPRLLPILEGFRLVVAERESWPGSYTRGQATEWTKDAIRRASPPSQDNTAASDIPERSAS